MKKNFSNTFLGKWYSEWMWWMSVDNSRFHSKLVFKLILFYQQVCCKFLLQVWDTTPGKTDTIKSFKKQSSWSWWYMPVILTIWEADAGGLQVQGQPQQFSKTLSNLIRPCLKIKNVKGWGCSSVVKHFWVQSLIQQQQQKDSWAHV